MQRSDTWQHLHLSHTNPVLPKNTVCSIHPRLRAPPAPRALYMCRCDGQLFFSPFFLRLCCLVLYSCQNKMYWRVSGPDNRLIFTLFSLKWRIMFWWSNIITSFMHMLNGEESDSGCHIKKCFKAIKFLPSRFKVAVGSWTHTTLFDRTSPDLTGIGTTDVRIWSWNPPTYRKTAVFFS